MTFCRLISPKWLKQERPDLPNVLEGMFHDDEIKAYNEAGYNAYYLPNHPRIYPKDTSVSGNHVDVYNCVFVDCDLKDGRYPTKDAFLETIVAANIAPTRIVDSGNGVHVYWNVSDLDAMSYLRFQRRLMRLFKTDEAVGQLFQLMRLPGTMNTKTKDAFTPCI